jgi:hypothetical protein
VPPSEAVNAYGVFKHRSIHLSLNHSLVIALNITGRGRITTPT